MFVLFACKIDFTSSIPINFSQKNVSIEQQVVEIVNRYKDRKQRAILKKQLKENNEIVKYYVKIFEKFTRSYGLGKDQEKCYKFIKSFEKKL